MSKFRDDNTTEMQLLVFVFSFESFGGSPCHHLAVRQSSDSSEPKFNGSAVMLSYAYVVSKTSMTFSSTI